MAFYKAKEDWKENSQEEKKYQEPGILEDPADRDLKNAFSAYVKTAVMNVRSQYLTKQGRITAAEQPLSEDEEYGDCGPEDLLQQAESMAESLDSGILEVRRLMEVIEDSLLYRTVAGLKKLQKEVLLLRVVYMKSFAEIDSILGLKDKQAEYTYYNAIAKIRRIMGGGKDGI